MRFTIKYKIWTNEFKCFYRIKIGTFQVPVLLFKMTKNYNHIKHSNTHIMHIAHHYYFVHSISKLLWYSTMTIILFSVIYQ